MRNCFVVCFLYIINQFTIGKEIARKEILLIGKNDKYFVYIRSIREITRRDTFSESKNKTPKNSIQIENSQRKLNIEKYNESKMNN